MSNPARIALVSAGNRSMAYSEYAVQNPDKMMICAIVDPNDYRRNFAAKKFNVPEECCFKDVEEFVAAGIKADGVINATMDKLHIPTTIPLLKAGYDVLLEKPICLSKEELFTLYEVQQKYGRRVMICHVLRYAPFYLEIKKKLLDGEIGKILHITTSERVAWHHYATVFCRGKWNSRERVGASFILAKCCHDLDIIAWLMNGIEPVSVYSEGNRGMFCPSAAPEGAGNRCMVDCDPEVAKNCKYNCKDMYIENDIWDQYVFEDIEHLGPDMTRDIKINVLNTTNPHGKCVYHADNDLYDRQTATFTFSDGTIATHILTANSARGERTIRIVGTDGEIVGSHEDGFFEIRKFNAYDKDYFHSEKIDTKKLATTAMAGHGGGDMGLMKDFIEYLQTGKRSISCTELKDSLYSHLMAYNADISAETGRKVDIERL